MEISINDYKNSNIEKGFVDSFEKAEGSRGGKVIGHTKSGKPVYDNHLHPQHKQFNSQEHKEASTLNQNSNHHETMTDRDEAITHHNRQSGVEEKKEDLEEKRKSSKEAIDKLSPEQRKNVADELHQHLRKIQGKDISKAEATKELVKEHKRLVDVLESPSHEDDKKEAKIQNKELEEYKSELSKAQSPEEQAKVEKVMKEFKEGKLKTSTGDLVTDEKQAIAIAMSEAGISKSADINYSSGVAFNKGEENNLEKAEGSRGGKVIGHTTSGKAIYEHSTNTSQQFNKKDHKEASERHMDFANAHHLESMKQRMLGSKVPEKKAKADEHTAKQLHHESMAQLHDSASKEYNKNKTKIEKSMETNNQVQLNQYKGSQIEKGFSKNEFNDAAVIVKIGDAFNKGLVDGDLLEKAVSEINLVKGIAEVGTHLTLNDGSVISKGQEGWSLEKAQAKAEDEEEKEEQEEGKKDEEKEESASEEVGEEAE